MATISRFRKKPSFNSVYFLLPVVPKALHSAMIKIRMCYGPVEEYILLFMQDTAQHSPAFQIMIYQKATKYSSSYLIIHRLNNLNKSISKVQIWKLKSHDGRWSLIVTIFIENSVTSSNGNVIILNDGVSVENGRVQNRKRSGNHKRFAVDHTLQHSCFIWRYFYCSWIVISQYSVKQSCFYN